MTRISMAALTIGLVLAACDPESPTTPAPDGIRIQQEALRLQLGATADLSVVDASGRDVTDEASWSSQSTHTATVDVGVVQAQHNGMTWVTAEYRGVRDSVHVTVPFSFSVQEGLALSLGTEAEPLALNGMTWVYQYLGGDDPFTVVNAAPGPDVLTDLEGEDFVVPDTLVRIFADGLLQPGSHTFQGITIDAAPDGTFALGRSGVMVWVRRPDDPSLVELWLPVAGAEVAVDELTLAPEEGPATGRMVGRLAFEAAGLLVKWDESPLRIVGQVDTATHMVYGEFDLPLRRRPLGFADVAVTGGPAPMEARRVTVSQSAVLDGAVMLPFVGRDGDWLFATHVRLGTPAVGDLELPVVDPVSFVTGEAFSGSANWIWSVGEAIAGDQATPQLVAYGQSGSVSVSGYTPPDETTFGRIDGTLAAVEAVYTESGFAGTQTVTVDFTVPLQPLNQYYGPPVPPIVDIALTDPSRGRIGSGDGTLVGRVLLDEREAVAGVSLTLTGDEGSATAVSREDGGFEFLGLEGGSYTISVTPPDGYGLAYGQNANTDLIYTGSDTSYLNIKLSDGEGNGRLQVVALNQVNGLEIRVRPEEGGDVIATIVTGIDFEPPIPGWASVKLPAGRYLIELNPPDGFALAPDEPAERVIEIFEGLLTWDHVDLVQTSS
ncbi:MAG: carboxypeptidase-like regulatory domain-containing protein [Gemmatimonadota bacterium]